MTQHGALEETSGGAAEKRAHGETNLKSDPPSTKKSEAGRSASKGKVVPRYHDRVEVYAYVTENDLRESIQFGVLQEVLIQSGTFFFSGAFWLLIELVIKQSERKPPQFEVTPWMGVCSLSILFGVILAVAGWTIFLLRQKKLKGYFPTPS
jgi:hypothetical protein